MINDEVEKCYYFAVKNLLELSSFEWLRSKKAAIIDGDSYFQNALNDALNYKNIKKDPQRISKIRSYISQYTVDSLYLDYSLSRTSVYFEQKARSLGHLCTP